MLMLPFLRSAFGLLSLVILGSSVLLLSGWAMGETRVVDGLPMVYREGWKLWLGLALLAWSFLGRAPVLLLLARPGGPRFSRAGGGKVEMGPRRDTIHVETTGPEGAPPIVLTHGWGMDASIWTPQRAVLGDRFRLILWDLPGLGRSRQVAAASITLENFAACLAHLTVSAGQPVILVGHSIGGMTIQTLARDRPDLFGTAIAGVVLLNTTCTNPLRTMILSRLMRASQPLLELGSRMVVWLQPLVWLQAWQSYFSGATHLAMRFGFGPDVTRRDLDRASLLATLNPPGAQARGNLAMFRWDASDALLNIDVPVLVIGGENDVVTRPRASQALADGARQGQVEVLAAGNHMSPLDMAPVYNRLIAEFAERIHRSGTEAALPPLAFENVTD